MEWVFAADEPARIRHFFLVVLSTVVVRVCCGPRVGVYRRALAPTVDVLHLTALNVNSKLYKFIKIVNHCTCILNFALNVGF